MPCLSSADILMSTFERSCMSHTYRHFSLVTEAVNNLTVKIYIQCQVSLAVVTMVCGTAETLYLGFVWFGSKMLYFFISRKWKSTIVFLLQLFLPLVIFILSSFHLIEFDVNTFLLVWVWPPNKNNKEPMLRQAKGKWIK